MPAAQSRRLHVCRDADDLIGQAAWVVACCAREALAERGVFHLVLAGGTTPEALYRRLAELATDWSAWQLYFGDERCVPKDDPARNDLMAREAWLDHVALTAAQIHAIPAELGADAAARRYGGTLADVPGFDLVLLGLGEDGHTASLFPGQSHPAGRLVHPVHDAPKPPPDRVTLSVEALGNARNILVLVTGAGKRNAVSAWRRGEPLPVAVIGRGRGVEVLVDRDAGG